MKKNDIAAVIDEQATERADDLGMTRDALANLPMEKKFATIVTGVRRAGKSTLLKQWTEQSKANAVSIHFDDLRLEPFDTTDFLLLDEIVRERKADTLVLDEPQDIEGWERYVNGNLDAHRQVLVTGSNAKMLSMELGSKLTGRHLDLALTPFTFSEFCRFTQVEPNASAVADYLSIGGFPAYVQTHRKEILQELFNDIIYRDIVTRYNLRDSGPIRLLANYLLGHIGCRISPSRLKSAIGVASPATVLEYFNYLEETYLLRRLPCFNGSPKAKMVLPKKVYACDSGLVTAVQAKGDINLGHKLENLVYNVLSAQPGELSYFIDDDDATECDFVLERPDGSFAAVQVAYELDMDNEEQETVGAVKAMKRLGLKESTLVTYQQSDVINKDGYLIRVVPAWEFL